MALRTGFVVNPRAGQQGRGGPDLATRVRTAASAAGLDAEVVVTAARGDAERLAGELARRGFPVVAAVGGDGTVNEVARGLLATASALAVVPAGSGNGFARDLGVSLAIERACRQIALGRPRPIDVGEVSGHPFLMTAGFGIDARVCHAFDRAASHRRGLFPYFRLGVTALASYRPPLLTLGAGGEERVVRPLLLVAANTRQFGGGAVVAPQARPDDGLLDLVLVGPRPAWRLPRALAALFAGSLDHLRGVEIRRIASGTIAADGPIEAQVDGEPLLLPPRVELACRQGLLTLWAPR